MKTQRIYVYLKEENFRFSSQGSALALMVMKTLMVLLIVMNVDDENDDASKYSG